MGGTRRSESDCSIVVEHPRALIGTGPAILQRVGHDLVEAHRRPFGGVAIEVFGLSADRGRRGVELLVGLFDVVGEDGPGRRLQVRAAPHSRPARCGSPATTRDRREVVEDSVSPPTSPASWKIAEGFAGVLGGLDRTSPSPISTSASMCSDHASIVRWPGRSMEGEGLAVPVLGRRPRPG